MTTKTEQFDAAIRTTTQQRGEAYGSPLADFSRAALIKFAVSACPHDIVRHALEMIGVKMSRLCTTPDHMDSVVDIAGYARTIAMILDEEAKTHEKTPE